ncbi:MAG: hypothetical protein K9G58_07915 [Bacteroidales bacterium]|nr:hypothetical protein [Bacteroidales bacterium]MCF8388729.1 hypothetical protein [Bacteroidales bacterium]MCF8398076.1 hypothetical protein [Bacteroidales bacterium]
MNNAEIIASIGVGILLLAFMLHAARWIGRDSKFYYLLNIIGAGIACYASVLIDFLPFIILEGFWAVFALFSLLRVYGRTSARS